MPRANFSAGKENLRNNVVEIHERKRCIRRRRACMCQPLVLKKTQCSIYLNTRHLKWTKSKKPLTDVYWRLFFVFLCRRGDVLTLSSSYNPVIVSNYLESAIALKLYTTVFSLLRRTQQPNSDLTLIKKSKLFNSRRIYFNPEMRCSLLAYMTNVRFLIN